MGYRRETKDERAASPKILAYARMTNPIVVTLEGAVRRLIGSMNIMVEPSTSFLKPLKPITYNL